MKLYYIFLSLTITILSSSFAQQLQPNVALTNKLSKPVWYSIGTTANKALNTELKSLAPGATIDAPLRIDIGIEMLLSSNPGEVEFFAFTPGKTVFVDIKQDKSQKVMLAPQTSSFLSFGKRKYPLDNNVTQNDIYRVSLNSHDIPVTSPDAFVKIYKNAPWYKVLGIPSDTSQHPISVDNVSSAYNALKGKWQVNNEVQSILASAWTNALNELKKIHGSR